MELLEDLVVTDNKSDVVKIKVHGAHNQAIPFHGSTSNSCKLFKVSARLAVNGRIAGSSLRLQPTGNGPWCNCAERSQSPHSRQMRPRSNVSLGPSLEWPARLQSRMLRRPRWRHRAQSSGCCTLHKPPVFAFQTSSHFNPILKKQIKELPRMEKAC